MSYFKLLYKSSFLKHFYLICVYLNLIDSFILFIDFISLTYFIHIKRLFMLLQIFILIMYS